MPSAGLEPATPATKRPHTYALDRAATGIGRTIYLLFWNTLMTKNTFFSWYKHFENDEPIYISECVCVCLYVKD
jgi:hypothetical protein